jgi:hypothetical protein
VDQTRRSGRENNGQRSSHEAKMGLTVVEIIPQSSPVIYPPIPRWRELLHARGISDEAIDRVGIIPDGHGWSYLVAPGTTARRWKAFPGQKGAKYLWKPSQPDNVRFYDPRGDLSEHVAAAGGVLILCNGEPAVWACWSAGLFNSTCTLNGETTVSDWVLSALRALGVRTVIYPPDCDDTGHKSAGKWRDLLRDSGITLVCPALPFEHDSKADINDLWLRLDQDPARLLPTLLALPPAELPAAPEDRPISEPARRSDPPTDYAELYETYCREVVEQAAIHAWHIAPANGQGWGRKNFSSPLREDRRPSARWHYEKHGFKDFTTGEFYNTAFCADLLGLPAWEQYKAEHRPAITRSKGRLEKALAPNESRPAWLTAALADYPDWSTLADDNLPIEHTQPAPKPALALALAEPRDPDLRLLPWNWTQELRTLLLGLAAEFPDLYEDVADLVIWLDRVIIPAELHGLIPLGATLAEKDLVDLNARLDYPIGENPSGVRKSARRAWEVGLRAGFFVLKTPKNSSYHALSAFGTKNQSGKKRGERGPSQFIILRDQAVAFYQLTACITAHAFRAAGYAPPGERFFAPDELWAGDDYGLNEEQAAAAAERRAPLLEKHAAERHAAQETIERAARDLWHRLTNAGHQANPPAVPLPAGVKTPNAAAYRAALYGQWQQNTYMVVPNKERRAAVGFKSDHQLRLAREKNGLVVEKRYKRHRLRSDQAVLEQLPDHVRRGWGWRLEASNGKTFEITHRDLDYVEAWAARQWESGATMTAQEQIASLERPADETEKAGIEARAEARRAQQRAHRAQRKALGLDRAPAERRAHPTPLDRLPERYTRQQALFGLDTYTDFEMKRGNLINRATGATIDQPTIHDLALAWAGVLRISEGADGLAITAYPTPAAGAGDSVASHLPGESEGLVEVDQAGGERAEPGERLILGDMLAASGAALAGVDQLAEPARGLETLGPAPVPAVVSAQNDPLVQWVLEHLEGELADPPPSRMTDAWPRRAKPPAPDDPAGPPPRDALCGIDPHDISQPP